MTTATTTLFSTLSLCRFLAVVALANLGFSYATTGQWANETTHQTRCISTEREALLEFKKHLIDPSNRLATWDAAANNEDCCSWYGVSCHHPLGDSTTQYVTGLHLRSLLPFEFKGGAFYEDYDAYRKTRFGGKVSYALLSLKHLRYLELSGNDFGGIPIPSFLGSMRSLRYLNLAIAGFGGMIPHQLGNLSNLQYLSLKNGGYSSSYDTNDVNLQWMSGLSSLKFLDLSGRDLSRVLNWNSVILTTLPSLLQLHLSWCQLPYPQPHLLNNNNINASSISILDLSINHLGHHPAIFLSWVSILKTLRSLNIEDNGFHGSIPRELQNMSSLRDLYLGSNYFNSSIPNWLYGNSKLKVLSLSSNQLSSFQPQSSGAQNFSSLSVLDLNENQIQGPIPNEIQNMTSLETLDLSFNNLEGKISSTNWNMPFLINLAMSGQLGNKLEFEGGIPNSFNNCCNLRVLDLEGVKLRQDINQVFKILSLPRCVSNGLEQLILDHCQLFGNLATTNQHFVRLMSLQYLCLEVNNLSGTLPINLGRLAKLEILYLYGNSLVGDVSEAHLENLNGLQSFVAYGNQLKLRVSPNWVPPFHQLGDLELGSWHIGPQFPTWLRSLKNLESLDLSNSGISSTIPVWFWNFSSDLIFLSMSHNQIQGVLSMPISHSYFSTIDLSSNRFHGPLPVFPSYWSFLDLSNNLFSGSISKFLCTPKLYPFTMRYLNLGQNHLYGEIPNCLAAWPELRVFNLSNNQFNGTIPESIGTLRFLVSLHLSNNSLSGELPQSLKGCAQLITVDVGENGLVGNISSFAGAPTFFHMKILILRSNKFSGQLPEKLCHATSLHILDLANNLFDGTIPSCLGKLSAMTKMNESSGLINFGLINIDDSIVRVHRRNDEDPRFETALIQTKGNMLEYSRNLGFLRSLDFSNNKLRGKIPEEITNLSSLLSLNLSHNALIGGIPKKIGFMQELESMDLSTNQLSGEIPQSISNLTFLGMLNLSQNRLSGRIPSGNQIQNFDASSFAGNTLCGSPLPNNCPEDIVPNDANEEEGEDDEDGMIWFYVSMAFGFVGGFWGFVGPLLLNRRWRFAYSKFMDRIGDIIWWKLHRFGMY